MRIQKSLEISFYECIDDVKTWMNRWGKCILTFNGVANAIAIRFDGKR